MIPTAVLTKLATLGLSEAQAEAVAGMLSAVETATQGEADAVTEKGREKVRARVQKWRAKQPVTLPSVTERYVTAHASASPAPDLENKQTNKEDKKTRTPRDELAVVLDADRVDAVIEHRIKLRKPLTAYAARQLAASFASCPDANAAADLMIESGWLKIKPDWIASRSRQNSHGPPPGKRMNAVEAYLSLEAERENEQTSGTIDHRDDEWFSPDQPGLPRPAGDVGQIVEWPVRQRDYQRR